MKQMTIETTRLTIQTASEEEMLRIIDSQTDDMLRKAYQEMLQGCLDHPEQWICNRGGRCGSDVGTAAAGHNLC